MLIKNKIVLVVLMLLTVAWLFYLIKKVSKAGEQANLTKWENAITFLLCLFQPIYGGIVLYYGIKGKSEAAAKTINSTAVWAFGGFILINFIRYISLFGGAP